MEWLAVLMFVVLCIALISGYPVALTLAGVSLTFAVGGILGGVFDQQLLGAYVNRVFGTITNSTLMAVPLFVLMGVLLERSKIAEKLLETLGSMWGHVPGGLALAVIAVGALMAASTGIVGATVVTMGLISLPTMLKMGYKPSLATGVIASTGTLGQIIPPSIALVLLGDVLSNAYQQAQLRQGIYNPETLSVGDLFVGAIIPGLILVAVYMLYVGFYALIKPQHTPRLTTKQKTSKAVLFKHLLPPILLIVLVLGSILSGAATPTEAAGVGAIGAIFLAYLNGVLTIELLKDASQQAAKITAMVFLILLGASMFSLVFRGFGGEELIADFLYSLPGGVIGATIMVMLVVFLMGFVLDFIEICFVVIPLVGPVLLGMGVDPLWLGIALAINLQTSFLTPPFGFALFYLRGVTPDSIPTKEIYRGVIPFIGLQLFVLCLLALVPEIATFLPNYLKGTA
ncbi:TRAP transporter large permease subunit [uncultured Umboniibacter sp.]|uniref:TRAP transporter large permease n=1 Tax=uncultured Umboniibacter sp. TaxID=1798917 RepID=UPI0026158107|nr:TRAP transporter large permease subunit [uncultured Umboniibacter sp.]